MTNPNCRVLIYSILRFISTKCCKTQKIHVGKQRHRCIPDVSVLAHYHLVKAFRMDSMRILSGILPARMPEATSRLMDSSSRQ